MPRGEFPKQELWPSLPCTAQNPGQGGGQANRNDDNTFSNSGSFHYYPHLADEQTETGRSELTNRASP